jgi:hypothetical protein
MRLNQKAGLKNSQTGFAVGGFRFKHYLMDNT